MKFLVSMVILCVCRSNSALSQNATNCSGLDSCNTCLSSNDSCYWCVEDNLCSNDAYLKCNTTLAPNVTCLGRPAMASIAAVKDEDIPWHLRDEIAVAAGTSKEVSVRARYFDSAIKYGKLVCRFNVEGRISIVSAFYFKPYDEVVCASMIFDYASSAPNATAPVEVMWGGSNAIDNPNNVRVVVYKCRYMASDCNACQGLHKRFGCGWCQQTNRCEIKSRCGGGGGGGGSGEWLDRGQTCSNPSIGDFSPLLGLWEGGTNVTIRGVNLGKSFVDVYGGVAVAGLPCEPYRHLYKPGKEIVCAILDGPGTSELRSGPVSVMVDNTKGESKQKFTFVDPKIEDISPQHGPLSGGTELTIEGTYLDAGSLAEVFINDLPCKIIARNSTEIKCSTAASSKPLNGEVSVKFDKRVRVYTKGFFAYDDCIGYTSCTACVSSSFPCDWCVDGNRCRQDAAENCRNDFLVTGASRVGASRGSGPTFCPRINSTEDGSSDILVPAGIKKGIQVQVRIIGHFIAQSRFVCQFVIEGHVHRVDGRLLGDNVYCDPMEFRFTRAAPSTKAMFSVIWGGTKVLDNPSNVNVVMYKCNEMAKSSDQCSTLEAKYSCGWCPSSNSCELKDLCKTTLR